MPRESVTACLIVRDERERLPAALESVAFCDEIVVVDGGSVDGTPEIAAAAGAKVLTNPWPGFAAQRNVAIDLASSDWIFELDADERVSATLRASVEALLSEERPEIDIAVCPLRNRFLGGTLGPSAKYPAYRARLFRRGVYRHDESRFVHEGIEPRGAPAILDGDIEHELAATPREALLDAWRYATLESAHLAPPRQARAYLLGIIGRPGAKLIYRTFVEGGWRDGWRGLAKIGLDVASDALVWGILLAGGTSCKPASRGREAAGRGHFGRRPGGQPKIVAIAQRGEPAERARRWLEALASDGLDVALISDGDAPPGQIPHRPLRRLSPLATMRAIDIEMQVRSVHAVVPFGGRAELVHRMLPHTFRPSIDELDWPVDR